MDSTAASAGDQAGGSARDPVGGDAAGGPAGRDAAGAGAPGSARDLARAALADARRMAAGNRAARRDSARGERETERRQGNRAANLRPRGPSYTGSGPDPADPQPVRALMRALFSERGWDEPVTRGRVFADWETLVGADIAAHCSPTTLTEGQLKLTATSSAWATQIRLMAPSILGRLATELGAGVVTGLSVTGPVGPSWRHGGRSVPGARGPRDTYG